MTQTEMKVAELRAMRLVQEHLQKAHFAMPLAQDSSMATDWYISLSASIERALGLARDHNKLLSDTIINDMVAPA